MKKIVTILLFTTILFTAGCGSTTIYRDEHDVEYWLDKPYVKTESSCWWGEARGKYNVSAVGYGTLCSGNGYCEKEKAIANPLEIENAGYDILVTLADDSTESITMTAGETKLISCKSGAFNGYLYIIVNSTRTIETEIKNEDKEKPYISEKSSCWWGEARGKYTISAEGYGAICSGNGYCEKEKAIANPLQIESEGYDILVTLADDSTENITMTAGETKLISCKSGAFKGYLYVIIN